jgi:hypothetical protein
LEVATFVEEALEIKAEIAIGKFQPQTLVTMSNMDKSVDAALVEPALQLLKSGQWQPRIEVHSDSMAVPEFNAERDARMGFMRMVAEMMTAAAPILKEEPQAGIGMLRMIQWAGASFRTGRTIEGVMDEAIKNIQKAAATPPAPPPIPPKDAATIEKDQSQALLNTAKAMQIGIDTANVAAAPVPIEKEDPEESLPRPPIQ